MPKRKKKGAARLPPAEPARETRVAAAEISAAAMEATEPADSARLDETSAAHVADTASSEEVPIATAGPATPEEEEARGAEHASDDPLRESEEDSARADPGDPLGMGGRDPAAGVADPNVLINEEDEEEEDDD